MIEYLDRPPPGWHVLDILRTRERGRWCAYMVDFDPDTSIWPPRSARRRCWVRIPGKHRSRALACAALDDMLATRH
jgi:hypothetical protein